MASKEAKCSCCGAETMLYVNRVPVCLECEKKASSATSSLMTEADEGPTFPAEAQNAGRSPAAGTNWARRTAFDKA
jgi:hypothetical protein